MTELTQNSILRISDEKTMQLIELYEQEECLWNTYLADYKNRDKRAKAAERIAAKLGLRNFEPRHVITKFKNLRNSYCQELKKIAHSLNSGLGDEEVYRPRVFWFSKMDSFLRPHLQPSRGSTQSNLIQEDKIKKELEISEETEEWVQMTNPEDMLLPDTNDQEQSCSENDETQEDKIRKELKISEETEQWVQMTNPEDVLLPDTNDQDQSCSENDCPRETEQRNPKKRNRQLSGNSNKKLRTEETWDENVVTHLLRDISANLHVLTAQKEDYFDSFGKYIAGLLRSMPPQKALNLQPKIVSLIASAVIGNNEGRVSQSDENLIR